MDDLFAADEPQHDAPRENAPLADRLRPQTLDELGELPGIGARKLDEYGEDFLDVIQQHS